MSTRRDFITLLGGAAALCASVSTIKQGVATLRFFFGVTLGCGEALTTIVKGETECVGCLA
jgi:hypothetical protein